MLNRRREHQLQGAGTVGNYPAKVYRIADEQTSLVASKGSFLTHFRGEAKKQLNLSHGQDDDYIESLVSASFSYFQRVTSHYLYEQDRETTFNAVSRQVQVPAVPWQSLEYVKVSDEGDLENLDTSGFFVEEGTLNVVTAKQSVPLPQGDTLKVGYRAGYSAPEDIPDGPAQALRMIVADLYEHRTSTPITGQTLEEAPFNADRLIAPFKVHTV